MSVFSFTGVQHFLAAAFSDLHKALTFVENQVPKVIADAPVVEGITAVVLGATSPAVTIERAAFSALGLVVAAAQAADAAEAEKGINVSLDAVTVAAFKALVADFSTEFTQLGIKL